LPDLGDLLAVEPQQTDARIKQWNEPHLIAVNPTIPANGLLLAFFAGSFGSAGRLRSILHCAAGLGYRAINLSYPNSWTVGELCRRSDDPECHAKVRLHIAEGVPAAGEVSLGPGNSIVSRLTMLLRWLHQSRPEEGWGNFFDSQGPRWESLVLAGHSQGGGHAALLAKRHRVSRVVMLGAPSDFSFALNRPAPWIGSAGETPAANHYGFAHVRDQGFARIALAWELLGLGSFGSPVNVDGERPPYRGSHQLVTDLEVMRDRFHASVATDAATPRTSDDRALYQPVWEYLFGGHAEK
jgi:hypothetical protein